MNSPSISTLSRGHAASFVAVCVLPQELLLKLLRGPQHETLALRQAVYPDQARRLLALHRLLEELQSDAPRVPSRFSGTGIAAIDALDSVVLGQKIPIFTESGLAHDELAMQILRQARVPSLGETHEKFAVVFVALGLPRDTAS